ncbi:MAG: DUF554 domain-containing protein [Eubacteriales bacterium]|nr:DUF554 domain-containing protein [Eubacteriales bacterium]
MFLLGTILNVLLIIGGGICGLFGRRMMKPRIQETLTKAMGLCVMFVGIGGTMEKMLSLQDGNLASGGTMMMVISFAVGSLFGEAADIEGLIGRFGIWIRQKTGNAGDRTFVDAFVTASLTVCIGAMAVVGAIQDGIYGDYSTLLLKGVLDAVIICVMTASMGKGCIFSAVPVALFQGTITLCARLLQPFMTERALSNLSFTGSMLIFCVGVNLIWEKKLKVANMLPAIIAAVVIGNIM